MPTSSESIPASKPVRIKKPIKASSTKMRATSSRIVFDDMPKATIGSLKSVWIDELRDELRDPSLMPPPEMKAPKVIVPPVPKRPSFYAFVKTGVDFDTSEWTTEKIAEALAYENWRERSVGETIKEFDIVQLPTEGGSRFEAAQCFKNCEITAEDMEIQGYIIHTMEGGGKPRKPIVVHETTEFKSMMEVPSGVVVKMPTDETEAVRFFGCPVIGTEIFEKGKTIHCFYPVPRQFANRAFRAVFSRIFSDFTKKHLREMIRSLIPNRGEGIALKRGVSARKILGLLHDGKMVKKTIGSKTESRWERLTSDEIYSNLQSKFNVAPDTIKSLLGRHDYTPLGHLKNEPLRTFSERMSARQLKPEDYRYEKAIGIEIETISPVSHEEAQKKIPHFMRTATDGSIKTDGGQSPRESGTQYGIEFRILCNRKYLDSSVLRATDALNKLNVKVNKSCGLHVHFDMRDKTEPEARELATKMSKWLRVLKDLLPAARRANTFCNFESSNLDEHYSAVSMGAYKKQKSIEVRAHSSTTNPIKILHWIRLIEAVIKAKYVPPATKMRTLDVLKMLDLSADDMTYWTKRFNHVNGLSSDTSFYGSMPNEDEGI